MARQVERLSALAVSRAKRKGFHPDGGGLYLQVTASGAKSWVYRFMIHGRAREMGLGPLRVIGLSEARAKAALCRRQRMEGIDPIESRQAGLNQAKLEAATQFIGDGEGNQELINVADAYTKLAYGSGPTPVSAGG